MTAATANAIPRSGTGRHRRSRKGAWWWVVRVTVATVLAVIAVAVGQRVGQYRGWEAWTAGHVTSWFTAAPAYIYRTVFYLDLSTPEAFGLRVTNECTSALVVIGLLGITAVLSATTRLPLRRLALAAVLSAVVFFLFNLARLVIIALATKQWGMADGFHWSHVWAGTFVTVIGGVGVFAIYLITIGAVGRHTGTGRAAT